MVERQNNHHLIYTKMQRFIRWAIVYATSTCQKKIMFVRRDETLKLDERTDTNHNGSTNIIEKHEKVQNMQSRTTLDSSSKLYQRKRVFLYRFIRP
jgi:hypothetical protein